ncbi:energy-coupling factor transporter transmembrane component T family protein [Isoptericola sediminis]|uniref:Energy-coupling factor transporter transmembrane protein EcfT n=1 Tax=Isoptericola sediminis TaxID=2733572 RepID=A0A849K8E4_9MICO|nr:energy-coupling factor transporter transmembrane component T [Isoptericola sediminis]NNU28045.1 energy-coupling factor transporter transmembrane protein EcfT [Isoptericola sediminis]
MTGTTSAAPTGGSPVHRLGAGPKLVALCLCSLALLGVHGPLGAGVAVVGVVALHALARLGPRVLWAHVRPLRWVVVCLLAVQWWLLGPVEAVVLSTRLVALVALAGLVTATTATQDVLDTLEHALRPGRRWGVDPERVALVLALTLRSVPVLADLAARVRDAQRARGREADVRAFAVPLVVGSLRRADALGEALRARGLDD